MGTEKQGETGEVKQVKPETGSTLLDIEDPR